MCRCPCNAAMCKGVYPCRAKISVKQNENMQVHVYSEGNFLVRPLGMQTRQKQSLNRHIKRVSNLHFDFVWS